MTYDPDVPLFVPLPERRVCSNTYAAAQRSAREHQLHVSRFMRPVRDVERRQQRRKQQRRSRRANRSV